jgi:cyclohexadienyl dehydratase
VVLRVGTTGDYAPFSIARNDGYDGFDLTVARLYARETGRRLEVVRFRWPDLVADLRAGRFDLAMGGITMRPERAVAGLFTRPVARAGAVVLAGPGAPAIDQPGVRLGINAGGHLERVAVRLFPDAILVRTPDNGRLPALLAGGAADAVLTDEIEAGVIANVLPAARRSAPFTRDGKAYLGTDPALIADLDRWLRAREADGTLTALRGRWLGEQGKRTPSAAMSDLDALVADIDLRLAFMPAVAAAKRAAGRPIEDPAQEAHVIEGARRSALAHGLAPDPMEALFRAIIAAARDIQRRFLVRPWPVDTMDLERDARPAIARLSDEIVARAGDLLEAGGLPSGVDPDTIAGTLDPSWATPADRLAIARAILGLQSNTGRTRDALREIQPSLPTFVKGS